MTAAPYFEKNAIFTKPFVFIAITNLLANTANGMFFVFPLFVLHIGGSKTDIGMVMGIMSLAAVLCRPWVSNLVDRVGRKRTLMSGCVMMAAVSLLHLLFQQDISSVFAIILGLRLFFGVGWAMCLVGAFTLATDVIPQSRFNQGIGIFGITNLIGIAIGPMLAEWLIRQVSFSVMFLVGAAVCVATVCCALTIVDRYVVQERRNAGSFFSVLGNAHLLKYSLVALFLGFSLAAHAGFVTPFAAEMGLRVGLYFAAYSAMAILSRIAGGRLADSVGEARILPFALLFTAIGFFLLIFVDSTPALILAGMVTGFGHGLTTPCLMTLAIRNIPSKQRGKANGLFSGGFDTGVFAGSLILGVIGERYGYDMLFISAGVSLVTAVVINGFWRAARETQAESPA